MDTMDLKWDFENWVLSNFGGQILLEPPDDYDPQKEFFYKIDGLQFRVPYDQIPKEWIIDGEYLRRLK